MTYSGDRSGTVEGQTSGPVVSELSPEDLEQLATEFRPSWELDEAPFAGGANFSSADVQSLQGGEARNRARQALVTTHNPAALDGLNLHDDDQRLFVVYRDDDGHTQARRIRVKPDESVEGLKLKLSELWMRGMLGGIPTHF